jgi:xanthine dehydrogenase YagS FAD-binding subunit
MNSFRYNRVTTQKQALAATGEGRAFVAGGTTLIDLMKLDVERPAELVDINPLPLAAIEPLPGGGVRIGALTRNSDLAHHDLIKTNFPVLSEALLSGASPQLRNMATVGGNIMQRTRCYYFRDTLFNCNKRVPGSGCPAIEGFNRIHAILGGSDQCIATHPSDMNVALVALDATVLVEGAKGKRSIPFEEFHVVPGQTPHRETVLEPGELITAVEIPASRFAANSLYLKLRDRASYEFALASVALAIQMESGVIHTARVAFGGVATKPWRAHNVEEFLTSATPSEDLVQRAGELAAEGAIPRRDNAFKVQLLRRAVSKSLRQLFHKMGIGGIE